MDTINWAQLCGEWESVAGEIVAKAPDSPEAKRLIFLSDMIRDRVRVRCVQVDPAAMDALATMRDALACLPATTPRIIGHEVTTPLANAYIAVRALREHEADRAAPTVATAEGISFAFHDEDLTILAEIHARGRLVKAAELDGCSGMPSKRLLQQRLNAMEQATPALVERPDGERSGYQPTKTGEQALRDREMTA